MSNDPEKLSVGPENSLEKISESARERQEQLDAKYETAGEHSIEDGERQEHAARTEALENAVSTEAGGAEKKRDTEPTSPAVRRGVITKKEREANYKKTLKHVQGELSVPSRSFSKVIHNKAVEKTSEAVGATIARPNAILAGSIAAFIVTTAVYIIAKNIGYRLSGFETIGAFIAGWVIGIVFDYFRVMITGKRSS